VDHHAGAAGGAVAVLVRDDRRDGEAAALRLAGRVVQVLVAGAERQHAGRQGEDGVGGAVAPAEVRGVRVQRARGGERGADGGRVILVDGRRAGRQHHAGRGHVVDHHAGAGGARGAVIVGDRGAHGIRRVARPVVQVLVRGAEGGHPRGQGQGGGRRAVA